jgi:hypothetical protein
MFEDIGNLVEQHLLCSAYKSKWGYHPCSFEVYQKLKQLYKIIWEAVRYHRKWQRWNEKKKENRKVYEVIRDETGRKKKKKATGNASEPPICPLFSHKRFAIRPTDFDGERVFLGREDYDLLFIDHYIISAYHAARIPRESEEEVDPLPLSEAQIDQLLNLAESWYGSVTLVDNDTCLGLS